MVRVFHLLAAAALLGVTAGISHPSSSSCSGGDARFGFCSSAAAKGEGVDVAGRTMQRNPGTKRRTASSNGSSRASVKHASCDVLCEYLKTHPDDPSLHRDLRATPIGAVVNPVPTTPRRPAAATVTRTPPRIVTVADVARFLATAGTLHAEPDGWAVVDVPANYWIDVEPLFVDGRLLGEAAQVRFTPLTYRWDYGDGTTRTTTDGGASWSSLGQEELTETPTSHVFRSTGARTVRVTVAFTAEYRLGGGEWLPVAGEVTAAAPPIPVRVVVERTLLSATG